MLWITIILLISTTMLGGVFFVLFRWAVKSGQFDDPEEAKYVIFREDEKHSNTDVVHGGDNNGEEREQGNKPA